jgi:hypothetical protein
MVDPDAVGTGSLLVTGEAGRICAAIGRVDHLARQLRAAGDPRTLRELRSDVALDLLLYGWATLESEDATASTSTRAQVPPESRATFMGQSPPAHVTIVVSLATLLGLDQEVAEIPGTRVRPGRAGPADGAG